MDSSPKKKQEEEEKIAKQIFLRILYFFDFFV